MPKLHWNNQGSSWASNKLYFPSLCSNNITIWIRHFTFGWRKYLSAGSTGFLKINTTFMRINVISLKCRNIQLLGHESCQAKINNILLLYFSDNQIAIILKEEI